MGGGSPHLDGSNEAALGTHLHVETLALRRPLRVLRQ